MTDDIQEACFEAGIKMGGLYHQFIGTPVSRESVDSLENAIERSVLNQRYVVEASISISGISPNRYGYDELKGVMLDVEITVAKGDVEVIAVMQEDNGYPLMEIKQIKP